MTEEIRRLLEQWRENAHRYTEMSRQRNYAGDQVMDAYYDGKRMATGDCLADLEALLTAAPAQEEPDVQQLFKDHSIALEFVRELASQWTICADCGICSACRAQAWLHTDVAPAAPSDEEVERELKWPEPKRGTPIRGKLGEVRQPPKFTLRDTDEGAPAAPQEEREPTLRDLAYQLGWGERMSTTEIYNFLFEREQLLRMAQAELETHKSNAPTAAQAIRDRIRTLSTLPSPPVVQEEENKKTEIPIRDLDRENGTHPEDLAEPTTTSSPSSRTEK
jgi:hypothetical protein